MAVAFAEHASDLRNRIGMYPPTAAAQTTWWRETVSWVRTVSEGAPLAAAEADDAARRDYEACVFVHISRGAQRRDALSWNRLYRTHAAPTGAA
jgi:hypothetical protein